MDGLPKAFGTEEERKEGHKAIEQAGDTTTGNVEAAIPLGELLCDTDLAYVRYMRKDEDLLYHVFRGAAVPQKFWGTGQYGLVVLTAAEAAWPIDTPHVEFNAESVRHEAVEDDPKKPSEYPPSYYSAYLVAIKDVDARPLPPDEERISRFAEVLGDMLAEAIAKWSNGS
ncbi:MAG: hypothetical protein KAY24_20135 [Candidatus Eisenbacteria sp.]|nr:hypothetical protein [Candidatus Eisenbacteria bacterium]